MGAITQEVKKVFPEPVSIEANGHKSVAYANPGAALI